MSPRLTVLIGVGSAFLSVGLSAPAEAKITCNKAFSWLKARGFRRPIARTITSRKSQTSTAFRGRRAGFATILSSSSTMPVHRPGHSHQGIVRRGEPERARAVLTCSTLRSTNFTEASRETLVSARTAVVAAKGAQILSWVPAHSSEVFWLSPDADLAKEKPTRGGVPICWPWFGAHPTIKGTTSHGFARTAEWSIASMGKAARAHTSSSLWMLGLRQV